MALNVPAVVTGLPDTVKIVGRLNPTEVTVPTPAATADNVPPTKDNPVPIVTLANPPEPLPARIDEPEVPDNLLLNVDQSAELRYPLTDAVAAWVAITY